MQLQPLAYPQIKFVSTFLASNRIHFGFMDVHVFKVGVSVHTKEHFSKIFWFLCVVIFCFLIDSYFPTSKATLFLSTINLSATVFCACHSVLVALSRYMQRVLFHRAPSSVFCLFFRCYFKLVVLLFLSLYSVLIAFFVKLTPLFPFSTSSIIIESFSCSIS